LGRLVGVAIGSVGLLHAIIGVLWRRKILLAYPLAAAAATAVLLLIDTTGGAGV
jgi:hypothetical protein